MNNNIIHCIREKLMKEERGGGRCYYLCDYSMGKEEEYIRVNNLRLLQRVTTT